MRITARLFGIIAVVVFNLISLSSASGQANVDESQETAQVYVDAVHGQDSNAGTQAKPLKTIGAASALAVKNNQANIGTKVIILPGTYRESVQFYGTKGDTGKAVTFSAASPGNVIVSGADVWSGWKVSDGNSSVYTHHWPNQWGMCPYDTGGAPSEPDIVRRREMIFVNGVALTQVLALKAMRVGTFYVSEQQSQVYIWPPSGTKIDSAKVEVASRDLLFNMGGKSNVVLRGLTFQYSSACRGDTAVSIHNSDNVLLDKDTFLWNNSSGLLMWQTTRATVQSAIAKYNGTSGLKGQKMKSTLWQNIRASYNGWRGAQGVFYKWGESALHFGLSHDQTLHKIETSWNQSPGVHWDTDNVNDVADSIVSTQNEMTAAVLEKTQGPITLSDSYFCNGRPSTGPNSIGITLRNSMNVTLTGNTVLHNKNQVVVTGEASGIPIENWETGEHYNLITQDLTFTNNVVVSESDQRTVMDPDLGDSNWTQFQKTLVSDYNTWWNADETMAFVVPSPDPWSKVDFGGWQSTSGADAHSSWKAPGDPGGPCKIDPEGSDFWFVMGFQDGYQTVNAGKDATFTANVVSLGFTGKVHLSSDGVGGIPGASGHWNANDITDSGSAKFTIKTSTNTPKGSYDITLLATSGNKTRTMSVSVKVN